MGKKTYDELRPFAVYGDSESVKEAFRKLGRAGISGRKAAEGLTKAINSLSPELLDEFYTKKCDNGCKGVYARTVRAYGKPYNLCKLCEKTFQGRLDNDKRFRDKLLSEYHYNQHKRKG